MKEDEEGFCYPHIDSDNCINCGLCEKVCPLRKPMMDDTKPESFIIQHKDAEILRNSTSGGFFTAISKWAISNRGVVFGAAFDKNMVLKHSYAETMEDCKKFRGSKYVQSLIGDSYSLVKGFLTQGRIVVFSGTPCQVAGLYSFLRGQLFQNLVTVDIVCHGIPSPLLLRKFFSYQSSKFGSDIVDYRSRDKHYGYLYSTSSIWFKNKGKLYHKGIDSDFMLRLYFINICSRPSCYNCHFKTINRISDFTIFDCWDAPSTSSAMSTEGATNVFVHSDRGLDIFEKMKNDFIWAKSDISTIIKRDGVMIKHFVIPNPRRDEFFEDLHHLSIQDVEKKYLDCSIKKRLIPIIKPLFYKLGLFNLYLKLKNYKRGV